MGLHTIFFSCSCWGHNAKEYLAKKRFDKSIEDHEITLVENNEPIPHVVIHNKPEENENFGECMMLRKPVRKRTPKVDKPTLVEGKAPMTGSVSPQPTTAQPPV